MTARTALLVFLLGACGAVTFDVGVDLTRERGSSGSNTCQDPSTCNVCTACCHDYITDGAECDVCVQEQCKRLRPTPPPPTRKWEPCKEMDQQCGGAKNSCCPGLTCSPVGGGVFVCV